MNKKKGIVKKKAAVNKEAVVNSPQQPQPVLQPPPGQGSSMTTRSQIRQRALSGAPIDSPVRVDVILGTATSNQRGQLSSAQIQKMLDENGVLLQTIRDFESLGKAPECLSYQVALHRNLVSLLQLDRSQLDTQILPESQPQQQLKQTEQLPRDS